MVTVTAPVLAVFPTANATWMPSPERAVMAPLLVTLTPPVCVEASGVWYATLMPYPAVVMSPRLSMVVAAVVLPAVLRVAIMPRSKRSLPVWMAAPLVTLAAPAPNASTTATIKNRSGLTSDRDGVPGVQRETAAAIVLPNDAEAWAGVLHNRDRAFAADREGQVAAGVPAGAQEDTGYALRRRDRGRRAPPTVSESEAAVSLIWCWMPSGHARSAQEIAPAFPGFWHSRSGSRTCARASSGARRKAARNARARAARARRRAGAPLPCLAARTIAPIALLHPMR